MICLTKNANSNWSETLGVVTGETVGTKSTYDDVDDFHGWSETMSSPYSGFVRAVSVTYVDGTAISTPITPANPITTPGWTKNLKRVVITVSNADVSTNYVIETLVSATKLKG